MPRRPILALSVSFAAVIAAAPAPAAEVERVAKIPAEKRSPHYAGNRVPLVPSPLVKLPVGAVQPRGWLGKQLQLQNDGFHGHLGEISAFLKRDGNSWLAKDGLGKFGWEEVPYWLKGFGDCAYLVGDEKRIAEAKVWIEGCLASQRSDGYFGPRGKGGEATVFSTKGKYDLWPNMVMLCCLQSWYEHSGDKRVLPFMSRYFKWQLTLPDSEFIPPYWQQQRGADNLWSVLWLYNRTGEPWLLDLAAKTHRCTADWTAGVPNWHNVNMAQAFGGPALFYPVSKEFKHLEAAERNYQTIRKTYGRVPGGMFGGDENCRPGYADPRQAIETCGMVEMMYSFERLLAVGGEPKWADRCEDVAFNSLPAALSADMKSLRYLTAPNLVISDRKSKRPGFDNAGPMLEMNPHSHRCCQHNFGHGWPYFAEHLWMATGDGGLACLFPLDAETKATVGDGAKATIKAQSRYPFGERAVIAVELDRPAKFPLYLRIPSWCSAPTVVFEGKRFPLSGEGAGFAKIEREWPQLTELTFELPMSDSLAVDRWPENKDSISVRRGPLTFSLMIAEEWRRSGGDDRWPAFEILPKSPWNYGLEEESVPAARVVEKPWPADDMPFAAGAAPIELEARGRRISEWQTDRLGLVGLLQPSPARTEAKAEMLRLVPMGSARLRIAQFPTVSASPGGTPWVVPAEAKPLPIEASFTCETDTLYALEDGVLPKSSGDRDVPRFTFWPHKGTNERIVRSFDKPTRLSHVSVYWFDDGPEGGCRVPRRWRAAVLEKGVWRIVAETDSEVVKDRFNRLTFPAATVEGLRVEVELRPGMSAGVLEWKIE
ncbi:MAG TPA: beta-L-arabinofuranosidase domain-containing protein [Planctomycetia bacterium]|nr:beta-L-arabinofuranosidase domain-containing protein [Planctomycetia bacterium]